MIIVWLFNAAPRSLDSELRRTADCSHHRMGREVNAHQKVSIIYMGLSTTRMLKN